MTGDRTKDKGPLETGQRLKGDYEITGFLGQGGMGVVYAGQHLRLSRRKVAVKVLQRFADDKELQRFQNEAEIAADIRHSNVVRVYDFNELESGEPYIVMELLDGLDLDRELARMGPLGRGRALRLTWHCLDGLALAHDAGVVHKDLKPSNLFLRHPRTDKESLCVLDFGIARVADPSLALALGKGEEVVERHHRALTTTGNPIGTPQYMAPEYATDVHNITAAVDVYQMGIILAEMISGKPLVDGNWFQCAVAHSEGRLDIPQAIKDDGALWPVIRKATALNPADRFPDASAFRDALSPLIEGGAPTLGTSRPTYSEAPSSDPRLRARPETPAARRDTGDAYAPTLSEPLQAAPEANTSGASPHSGAESGEKGSLKGVVPALSLVVALLVTGGGYGIYKLATSGNDVPSEPDVALAVEDTAPVEDEPEAVELPFQDVVFVEAGPFWRGSRDEDDESPVLKVILDGYFIDKYEVTVARYRACVEDKACDPPTRATLFCGDKFAEAHNWDKPDRDDHPVNCVTWVQAREFCKWDGKRLPTEAEWEKAARGDDGRRYPWGAERPDCTRAIIRDGGRGCGEERTWPVGSRPKGISPHEAHDMAGNVYEWVHDIYHENYYSKSPKRNPTGALGGKKKGVRGGSWFNPASNQRAADRTHNDSFDAYVYLGFRCASSEDAD